MNTTSEPIILSRDVTAVQIPAGNSITLKQGATVGLTQSLGGSFTVHDAQSGGLFRIEGSDADALGLEPIQDSSLEVATDDTPLEDRVWAALKTCYDPEIPVNIVDLGLIYSMELEDDGKGGKKVSVKMTLTAPGCGMGPSIAADAKQKLLALEPVSDANVEVVWEPTWNPSMITADGKAKLGIE